MAKRLSVLIFSRDDAAKAIALAKDIYEIADEIVLIDSSMKTIHSKLVSAKARMGLAKLRIYYAIPLGYPDPLRVWALKKCTNGWVMLLDTDERLSPALKSDLHKIINKAGFQALSIRRYEEVGRGFRGSFTNWQTRLFKKGSVTFKGIIHEEPAINGHIEKITGSEYYIDHVAELRGNAAFGYSNMEKFLRMSYKDYNLRLIDYFYKVTVPDRQDRAGAGGASLKTLLTLYEKLGLKHAGEEASHFDYFMFYYLMAVAMYLKKRRISGVFSGLVDAGKALAKVKAWQREEDATESFEISKILYKEGLIKFLELDKDSTIKWLNKRYSAQRGGIGLLIGLLKLRYERGKRWME